MEKGNCPSAKSKQLNLVFYALSEKGKVLIIDLAIKGKNKQNREPKAKEKETQSKTKVCLTLSYLLQFQSTFKDNKAQIKSWRFV